MAIKKSIKNNISNQTNQTKSNPEPPNVHLAAQVQMALNFNLNSQILQVPYMTQQEKEKRKLIKSDDSDDNHNSHSQQNGDDEDDSMNDFIANDDEASDDYDPRGYDNDSADSASRKKSKKEKKKLKRRLKKQRMKEDESQLDQGDLDILEQQQLEGGRLNRLKKKTEQKKISYSDEDQEQEREDFEQRDGQSMSEISGGYRQESEQQSGLKQAFGDDGGDIFQPEDEKRFFQQQQDKQIIALDIPQRYYYQLRNYAKTHNISIQQSIKVFQSQDRNAEVKWIYAKHKFPNGEQRQVKQKIRNVLEALHKQKVQIMFIYYYRRKIFADILSRDDLWKIYSLDQEWFAFKEQFNNLRDKLMNVIFSFQEMPRLENMIQQTVDIQKLKYFREFQSFKLVQDNMGKRKNIKNEIITQIKQKRVDDWLQKSQAFLSPQNLCHNLINRSHDKKAKNPLNEPRQELQRVLRSQNPQNQKVRYPLLVPDKRIQTICHYLQLELFSHPQLRKFLKQEYYRHLIISTNPTKKGQQDINLYSQYFPVKRIKDKPIRTMNRQVWVLAQQAEKNQLISIQLRFEWEQSGLEQRNFEGDIVYKKVIQYYYEISVNKQGQVWNLFRRQVITKMLTDYFFPAFFKQIKDELNKQGEQTIIRACSDIFKAKLLINPNNKRILAMMLEDKKLGIVYVDQFGQQHSPLQITLSNDEELKRFATDEIIRKYVDDFKPELICIGANSRRAQTLRKAIRESQDLPFCSLCPYEIPSLVAKQRKLQGSSQQITVLEAISMARFQKNPLVETLSLWSSKTQQNGILAMNLHPYQSFIDQRRLRDALELIAVEVVNLVGVDINELKYSQNDSGRKILQFVCGFGPRKAFDFYEKIKNQTIFNRKQIQELVSGKLVYKNCSPFFKVQTPFHRALLEKSEKEKKKEKNSNVHLLDATRIPTEWYKLTQNLALKAIKNVSIDMRPRKIYTNNYSQETIALIQMFKDPSKVNSIEWIWNRQELPFFDQKLVKQEFHSRFRMPNQPRYQFTSEELFYSLLRETKHTLKKYMIVTVKIISVVKDRYLNVVIPENGLFGSIKISEPKIQYQKGNFIKAIISSSPAQPSNDFMSRNDDKQPQLLKVQMSLYFPHKTQQKGTDHNCFEICFKNIVKEIHPLIDLDKDRFDLKKQDRPVLEVRQDSSRPMKTQFRKISHKKFKNLAVGPAIELIRNSPIGEFVIRPSSDGMEFLNITWHFFSGVIAHIKVKSEQKNISTSAPVYRIISDKDNKIYESLDKIIDEYITPMNSLVQDVISNRKFMADPVEKIEQKAKIDMSKDPNLIHYFFGCSPQYPQYFLLVYLYRDKKPIKELIKVRSTGLYFHDQVFSNIRELIAWFKNHFKQRDYQSFVKKFSLKK